MSIARFHTLGAVASDLGGLKRLEERLSDGLQTSPDLVVLARRRDARVIEATLPGARVQRLESSLSRLQWFEFASMYFAATAAIFLIGAMHLVTGLISQAVLTVACLVGLFLYHRSLRLRERLSTMALPDSIIREWEGHFTSGSDGGFALALATVAEEDFDEAHDAFLDDELDSPFTMNRRLVL